MPHVRAVYALLMTTVLSVTFLSAAAAQTAVTGSQPAGAIEPVPGVAMLQWSRPVQNSDGSPLTDLAGYVILYGTGSPVLYNWFFVDADVTELELGNLAAGDWYFLIASVNTAGVTSQLSPTVGSTIQ